MILEGTDAALVLEQLLVVALNVDVVLDDLCLKVCHVGVYVTHLTLDIEKRGTFVGCEGHDDFERTTRTEAELRAFHQ